MITLNKAKTFAYHIDKEFIWELHPSNIISKIELRQNCL
jgi:hypothetical protein